MLYKPSLSKESYSFWKPINSWCIDALYSHYYQIFDECGIFDLYLLCYIEIHTDGPQKFRLLTELIAREECWIKFGA
jgi:hypothetical protein